MGPAEQRGKASTRPCGESPNSGIPAPRAARHLGKGDLITCHGGARNAARRARGGRRYDYGGPSRYIAEHARPGDGILFFGRFYRKAELGYPGGLRNTSDFAMAVSPLRAGDFQGRDKPFAFTYPLMLGHRRIWVFGTRPSTRKARGLISDESMALERRFTLIARHRFHRIIVTLWLRR